MCRKLFLLVCFVLVLGFTSNSSAMVWTNEDIGGAALPGSTDYNSVTGVWTVMGDAGDIWGGADGFHYVFRPLENNGVLEVNLASMSMDDMHAWAKAGVMIRETLEPGSTHAAMMMTGANGVQFVWRSDTNGGSSSSGTAGEVPPKRMRITRLDDQLIGEFWMKLAFPPYLEYWQEEARVTIPMNEVVYIGLAVCSQRGDMLCTAVFDEVIWPAEDYYRAWKPSPVDGAQNMALDTTVSWLAGEGATSHNVYFDLDGDGVVDDCGNQTGTTFDPGPLQDGTVYRWRIDEVGLGGTVMGNEWSFKTERLGTGSILGQIWWGIGGTNVSNLTGHPDYPTNPSDSMLLPSLEAPVDMGDNFGGRMVGYLVPEISGDYTFWIASDDDSELWLSTSEVACDATVIASVSGWACSRCWDWNPSSDPIPLEGGQRYYIMAIYKEGGGGDNCSVAWQGPDSPSRSLIDGYYLSPDFPGDIWAVNPSPASGVTMATKEITELRWSASVYADEHNVYLGTDPGALSLVATKPLGDETYALGPLVAETTYYWKIDEVSGSDVVEGCLWSFTVTDEWIDLDISSWGGGSEYDEPNDTWTIVANGADIWDSADRFHYVYKMPELTRGDCTITVKVTSVVESDYWAKAGPMIRESRNGNSKQVMVAATPHCTTVQVRSETGAGSWSPGENWDHGVPWYVKLVRDGDNFTGYRSNNGTDWIQTGSCIIEMPPDVLVGMAVTSHNTGALTTAVMEGLSITTTDPRKSWGPSPANGAEGLPVDAVLSWGEGEGVMYNIVYFSDNYDDVASGDAFRAMLPAGQNTYNPGILDLTKTYYWCVDALWSDGRDFDVVLGNIWSFTISDHRLIDDFESYDVIPQAIPAQSLIEAAICPPAQTEVEPGDIIVAVAPPAQSVIVEGYTIPGYTIPGYTIEAVAPDAGCLIADWAFEGDYTDSISGFDGDPCGDATIVADGTRGNVLSLDGDGDYVDCGNPAALNFGTGNWSLSAWVKTAMTGTGDDNKGTLIANGGDGGGGHRYCMILSEQDEGEVTLVTDDDADKRQARGDTTKVNDDVWHHVLGVRDGDTIRIYIDGVEEGSAGLPADYDLSGTSQANVLIGAMTLASDSSIYKTYAGLIDDAQIYTCALTEGNARFLADIGDLVVDPIVVDPVVVPPVYGPMLLHYEFEGDAADSSGNNYDGTELPGDGSLPTYEAGAVGQAIRFTDDGDHVFVGDTGSLMDGLSEMTVSAWIKSEETDRDEGWIIFGTDFSDKRGMRYDKKGGSSRELRDVIKYGVYSDGSSEEDESSGDVQTTSWQHVAMTWQSGVGLKLYINGVLNTPGWNDGAEDGVTEGYSRLLLGKGGKDNSSDESWNGLVDDVRIYNAALSYGEIRYLAGEMADLAVPATYGPLIAEYTFDSDASDSSGNGFHGTLLGDATVAGGVLFLDGDGDCVDLGHHAAFNPGTGPLSISAWVNMSSHGDNWANVIISKRGENRRGWQLRRLSDTQRISFTTRNCGDQDGWGTGGQNISLGAWHHVVAVRDGTQKWLYIDGQKEAISDICEKIEWSGHNAYIGGRATGDNRGIDSWFNGVIDDMRIYNIALTEDEVQCLGVGDTYGPLLVHFEFEGNLDDSTDNDVFAVAQGDPGYAAGYLGDALDLDGDGDYVSVRPVGISGAMPRTITCWAKAHSTTMDDWSLIFGFSTPGGGCDSHFNIGSLNADRVGAHTWCWEQTIFSDEEALEWRHYAMTYDGGTIKYYGDGVIKGSAGRNLVNADVVMIGKRTTHTNSFNGLIDDARIYNYALSWPELLDVIGFVPTNLLVDTWTDSGEVISEVEWQAPHWGNRAIKVDFSGDGEVSRPAPFENWTLGESKTWVLYFKGDPDNEPEDMYVTLKTNRPSGQDVKLSYDGDISDLKIPEWQQWNISLDELASSNEDVVVEGVPLPHIGKLALGLSGSGTVYFDDLWLMTTRCVPKYGPLADFTGDCKVDYKDLRILADEWMDELQQEDWNHRVAYYDGRYPTGWADVAVAEGVRDYLSAAGYTVVDANELKTWMDARIADGALSVVVMCQDIAPDTVAETRDAACTLRRYLDAGGKVVQYADIPFYNQGHADGSTTNWATDGSVYILGFNAAGAGWGSNNTVSITDAGLAWGLTQKWNSHRPAAPGDVDTILATDDDGDASAWAKHYVPGDSYRGFVYIADFDPGSDNIALLAPALLSVAEYKGALVTDLYEDYAINFMDFAVLADDWLGVQLFP